MGFTKGQKITLKNVTSYESSTTPHKGKTRTGTYYIWSAATKNGRIRITEKKSYCGKNPASKFVLCWVKTSSISTKRGSNSSKEKVPEAKTILTKESKKAKETKISVSDSKTWPTTVSVAKTETLGQIGYLGKVLFIVRDDQIKTVNNFVHTMSASFAEHERHLKAPILEFTGVNSQTVTFDIELSVYLGQKPVKDSVEELYKYLETGKKIQLKLGKKTYGPYRWCIKQMVMNGKTSDTKGNWTSAKLSVSLISTVKK